MPHADREVRLAYHRAYYKTHKANMSQKSKAYAEAHREEISAYHKQWETEQGEEYQKKRRLADAVYRAENQEKERLRHERYARENPEKIRAKNIAYRENFPEKRRASCTKWRKKNLDVCRVQVARYRAQKAGAVIHDFTAAQWREMKAAYGYQCVYCGRKMERLTQDHLTPISKGGAHTASNIVPACGSCNSRKGAGEVLKPVQPLLLTLSPRRH